MPNETTPVLDGPALWSAQAHLPSVLGRQLVIERGEGCYIYTRDGRRLFDGTAGLWHANVGHSRPELAEAAYQQSGDGVGEDDRGPGGGDTGAGTDEQPGTDD
ncbi:aminotransferase class III-fold pyridoxal phosphate-dependent enzyme, partial [Streptomyces sp. NPDC005969]|uniref:aminotransferase class III-fold pyridoxal phosphate-dependent enzyme n=1 Tax=Streptomyces sp. NPDC005969 TaxID=3156722 RepID=UPI0033C2D5B8